MKVVNRVEIKLDNFDKCSFSCDSDSSLGVIFDYACALKSFIVEKMKANEESEKSKSSHEVVNVDEVKSV